MPTRRKARTDFVLCCLAAGLFAVVQAVPLPPAYAGPQSLDTMLWLGGCWLGWRCVVLQRTSRQRWHLTHNTPVVLAATDVERLYDEA